MKIFKILGLVLCLSCCVNATDSSIVKDASSIPQKNLSLVVYDGNILETSRGVELVIKAGQVNFYSATQNWTIPIKNGNPVIPANLYSNPEIKKLLNPRPDGTLIFLTGSTTIQVFNPNRNIKQGDLVQQMLETNKAVQVLVVNGKIKGVFQQKITYSPYEGGLVKFEKGAVLP